MLLHLTSSWTNKSVLHSYLFLKLLLKVNLSRVPYFFLRKSLFNFQGSSRSPLPQAALISYHTFKPLSSPFLTFFQSPKSLNSCPLSRGPPDGFVILTYLDSSCQQVLTIFLIFFKKVGTDGLNHPFPLSVYLTRSRSASSLSGSTMAVWYTSYTTMPGLAPFGFLTNFTSV